MDTYRAMAKLLAVSDSKALAGEGGWDAVVLVAPDAGYPIVKAHLAAGGRAVIAQDGDASCTLHLGDTSEPLPDTGEDALAAAVTRFLHQGARTASGAPVGA